jgi:hypothetical protein
MLEIAEYNKGDDSFTEKMIDVLNLVANAHQYFRVFPIKCVNFFKGLYSIFKFY